jgi:hypothetical protein
MKDGAMQHQAALLLDRLGDLNRTVDIRHADWLK